MTLTDTKARTAKPRAERYELPDGKGLELRVAPTGIKTWVVLYRVRGQGPIDPDGSRKAGTRRRLALGEFPYVSIADARALAADVRAKARRGEDPQPPEANGLISESPKSGELLTVKELAADFVERHVKRGGRQGTGAKRGHEAEANLKLHVLPSWGHLPAKDLRAKDLVALLEHSRTPRPHLESKYERLIGGPGAAREVRKQLRTMWGWAVSQGLLEGNPFVGVKAADPQRSRKRVLSLPEIRAIWKAAHLDFSYPWGPMVQLIALTGCRRDEIACARWSWLNISEKTLTIPEDAYKTGRNFIIPLSAAAMSIIEGLPRPSVYSTQDFMFSTQGGEKPVRAFSKLQAALRVEALKRFQGDQEREVVMEHWTLHDLRRTMATEMGRLRVPPHVIDACQGHVVKGTAETYQRYGYIEEKRASLELWASQFSDHSNS